jgi:zinc protease
LRTISSQSERDPAIKIFAQLLHSPKFDRAILDREKTNLLSEIKQSRTRPEQIAERAFFSKLYGDHHYALEPDGTLATIPALTPDDLRDFYLNHYAVNLATIAIVSDLPKDEIMAIAETLAAGLPKTSNLAPLSEPKPLDAAALVSINHPATQSHILMGTLGLKRGDPDYFPLYVGNHILGGSGFGSRLVENVREKQGLAYSVYSYFISYKQNGPFILGLQTQKEQTQRALGIVNSTLHQFLESGPTASELADAKKNIIGGFPLRFDSNKELLEYAMVIGFYKLPLSYLDDFIKNVDKVSLDDIRDAFKRRVHPNNFVTVIVGGPN